MEAPCILGERVADLGVHMSSHRQYFATNLRDNSKTLALDTFIAI